MFHSTVYVKVSENRFWIRHIENGRILNIEATTPFTTSRLLVGNFKGAEAALKPAIKQIIKRGLLTMSPEVLIQPLEKTDDGLSEVEERVLLELAYASGARKAVVYVGSDLSDANVKLKLQHK